MEDFFYKKKGLIQDFIYWYISDLILINQYISESVCQIFLVTQELY